MARLCASASLMELLLPMLNCTAKRESSTYGDTPKYAVCKPYSPCAMRRFARLSYVPGRTFFQVAA